MFQRPRRRGDLHFHDQGCEGLTYVEKNWLIGFLVAVTVIILVALSK